MKNRFAEHGTLFASIVKWAALATIVGIMVGAGTALFLKALGWASGGFTSMKGYYFLLPVTLLASSMLVRWLAPDAEGHGTEKIIEAVHERMGRIPFAVVPVKLVATVLTLASGGSAGKEGPCAQIGAGLASSFASALKVNDADRRKLVICGISAGFASVFGTPIAGALFGIEVLVLGQMLYDVLLPSFIAGITGYLVAISLGISYSTIHISMGAAFSGGMMLKMIFLGIWCGLIAVLLIEALSLADQQFARLPWYRPAIGGAILAVIALIVGPEYLGLGLGSIEQAHRGETLPVGAFFWKSVTTAVTLGCGGSGGIVTPIFFIGSAAGNLFSRFVSEPGVAALSAIGMSAMLAAAANTPISASIMAIEMFGPEIAPYAAVACVVSFLMVGHRSVYPSQILALQKSTSITVAPGKAIGRTKDIRVVTREASLIGIIQRYATKWFGKRKKPGP